MKMQMLNWIYLTPCDPLWQEEELTREELGRQQEIAEVVRAAVTQLKEAERQVIERYHFEGVTLPEIAKERGKPVSSIISLHRGAVRSLRKLLADFAKQNYGIDARKQDCPLCSSPHRKHIDKLILDKKPEEPYRILIGKLRSEYGIKIISPQTLVGHIKYHS